LIAKYLTFILQGLAILISVLTGIRLIQYVLISHAGEAIEATVLKKKIPEIAGPKPNPDFELIFKANGAEKSLTVRGFNFFNPPIFFFTVFETGPLKEQSKVLVWTFKNYFFLPFKPTKRHFSILGLSFLCYHIVLTFFILLVKYCSTKPV